MARCRDCGTTEDVEEMYDPFQQEVNGVDELAFFCRECYRQLQENADDALSGDY
jgi:hypothetical protein